MEQKNFFLWDEYFCEYFAENLEEPKKEFLNKIKELETRDDDVWVVTLPKCGTTWMQELVWLVLNNFDFETAKKVHIEKRGPNLEFIFLINEDLSKTLDEIEKLKSPRLIKTHLPLSLLPRQLVNGKGRFIYVYRNPADALVSMYHHLCKGGFERNLSLEDSIKYYIKDNLYAQVTFDHVAEIYELRGSPSLFYTSYECMKRNLSKVISDVCRFLNKSITESQLQQMLKHLSFEEMQNNPKVNMELSFNEMREKFNSTGAKINFIRKGKIDSYKEELSAATALMLEEWINENLSKRGLKLADLLCE